MVQHSTHWKRKRGREHDDKRRRDQPWRKWYRLKAWLSARAEQLGKQPLCELCLAMVPPKYTPADTVHHKQPHRGDWDKFINPDNHCSSCKPCHDGAGQMEDHHGYLPDLGADGWPIDARHPANRPR